MSTENKEQRGNRGSFASNAIKSPKAKIQLCESPSRATEVLPRVLLRQLRRDRDHVGEEVWVNFDTSWYTGKIVQQSSADGGSINVHFPADDETELFTWREATRDVWLMKHDGFVLEVYTIETDGETLDEISSKKAQDVSLLVALNKRRYKSVKGSSRMQVGSSLLIAQVLPGSILLMATDPSTATPGSVQHPATAPTAPTTIVSPESCFAQWLLTQKATWRQMTSQKSIAPSAFRSHSLSSLQLLSQAKQKSKSKNSASNKSNGKKSGIKMVSWRFRN